MRTFSSAVRRPNTAEIWNERTNPRRAMSAGSCAGGFAALVEDATIGGREELAKQIETGRLAGSVGADDGMDRPRSDGEIDVLDGDEAKELLGQVLGPQYRLTAQSDLSPPPARQRS